MTRMHQRRAARTTTELVQLQRMLDVHFALLDALARSRWRCCSARPSCCTAWRLSRPLLARFECAVKVTAALCSAHICGDARICEQLIYALLDERLSGALNKVMHLHKGDAALVAACHGYNRYSHQRHRARGRRACAS